MVVLVNVPARPPLHRAARPHPATAGTPGSSPTKKENETRMKQNNVATKKNEEGRWHSNAPATRIYYNTKPGFIIKSDILQTGIKDSSIEN